jgi:hypothetical protein
MPEQRRSLWKIITDSLPSLLQPDVIRLGEQLIKLLHTFPWKTKTVGTYEVLEHECQLELRDARGRNAVYIKRQVVRFLQDNVIAYQDDVWGDGDIFADYECSPGIAVDRYKEGHRHHVLISLRKTMNRGDVQEFHIRRRIRNGFTKWSDDFQVEVNHHTRKLTLKVTFPSSRWPKQCWLNEQNMRRTRLLGAECLAYLPDKRLEVTWHTDKPTLFEAYSIRWQW